MTEWQQEFPLGQDVRWGQLRATVIGYTARRIRIRLRNGTIHVIAPWNLVVKI